MAATTAITVNRVTIIWSVGALLLATNFEALPAVTGIWTYNNRYEWTANGDFDGDGRQDAVVVDKTTGNYRIGYQDQAGTFAWAIGRISGIREVTGFSIGKVLDPQHDALVFASTKARTVNIFSASDRKKQAKPIMVPLDTLGPNTVVAIDIGGAANTPDQEVFVGSIYMAETATCIRQAGGKFTQAGKLAAPSALLHAQRTVIKPGGQEYLTAIVAGDQREAFVALDLATGKPVVAARIDGLPENSRYVIRSIPNRAARDILIYQPGERGLSHYRLEAGGNKITLSKQSGFSLEKPVFNLYVAGNFLVAIDNPNEPAVVYSFDGSKPPAATQTITGQTNELINGAFVAGNFAGVLFRTREARRIYSTRCDLFRIAASRLEFAGSCDLPPVDPGDLPVVPDIHEMIAARVEIKDEAQMHPYTNTIPGSSVQYVMLPVKSGEFTLGSPETEPGRKPDEGPSHKVKLDAFWMGKHEVTWNEFQLFEYPDDERKLRSIHRSDPEFDKLSDQVARPTGPYVDTSFGMGKNGFPAIGMTQHGANKYCMWLSAKTGHFYRLPTEAEWEYACRAGTTTAYSFGDDASRLGDYAWFEANSQVNGDWKYHKIGTKNPNPWGFHDMHGNAAEWCLDQYMPDYKQFANGTANPWVIATKPYPHAVRGGSYDHESAACRSSARIASSPEWKFQDPQQPKCFWYFTDVKFVGFRLVRPLKVASAEEMQRAWISGVEKD